MLINLQCSSNTFFCFLSYMRDRIPILSEYTRDIGGRLTNAVCSATVSGYGYDARSQVVSASVGTNAYAYSYDSAGNRTSATANGTSAAYASNAANQYTLAANAEPEYAPGGWLSLADGLDYWFDDEDRLVSVFDVTAHTETFSRYDHLHRRIARQSLAWSPDGASCVTNESRTFAWDGWSAVREWREVPGVPPTAVDYYWGADLSGTLQGAGGVGGLLAVSAGGAFYLPLYDANGHQKSAKPKSIPPGDRDFIAVPRGRSEERYPATQRQLYLLSWNGYSLVWDPDNRLDRGWRDGSDFGFFRDWSGRVFCETDGVGYTERVFDGWNPVFERTFNGLTETPVCDTVYVWGSDLSGTMHGAGGVGGLLAVKRDGAWYACFYDG